MSDVIMKRKLELGLLLLRWFCFLVLFVWTVGIFVAADESGGVFGNLYRELGLSTAIIGIMGSVQIVVLLAFVSGARKSLSYVLVFLLQLAVTLSLYSSFLEPWDEANWLSFATLPMLGALYVLYLLQDYDRLLSLDSARSVTAETSYPDSPK